MGEKIINSSNEEVQDKILINTLMNIIEITGYSFEYIHTMNQPRYNQLAKYCNTRVQERRATAKALGVKIEENL